MPYEIVVAGLSGAGVDTWALWAKIMGAGATVTLSALLTLFTWALYRHRDQAASAALHFTVANLCATTYVASDIAVRLCLLTDNLGAVMVPYRLSLSAVVLALASLIALYQVLGDRPGGRRLAAIYMVGAALTGLIWLEHPWLVLASHDYRLTAVGVFADYGALAGPFYAVCLAVLAVVAVAMLRRAHQARGRVLWRMTVFGFSLFFAAGVHDAFRELGWEWLPFSTLASAPQPPDAQAGGQGHPRPAFRPVQPRLPGAAIGSRRALGHRRPAVYRPGPFQGGQRSLRP